MPIRRKSIVFDPKVDLVTITEELIGKDGKVKKTKQYQIKKSENNPKGLWAARQKHFGVQG